MVVFFFFFRHREAGVAVYQVNRSGHANCDVADGTLLDITPLTVDESKVVTLYDKDLTEGINFLISEFFLSTFSFLSSNKLTFLREYL